MEERSWCRWQICALTSALLLAVGFIAAEPVAQAQESAPPSIHAEELLAPYGDGLKDAIPAYSDEREAIVTYKVDATVLPNTDMRVDELITYNTGTDKVRHGLIRDIPTIDVLDNGMQRSYDVSLIAVTRDGGEVPYTVDDSGGALSLRIGDESIAILGRHEFRISYLVKNGLDVLQESDLIDGAPPEVSAGDVELFWDFVGDEWSFPVYEADVSIIGPAPALAAECDADPGYAQGCAVDLNGGPRGATTMRASAMGWPWIEGYLSGVIAWAPDAFTQLPAPVITEPPQAAENTRAVRNLRISALLGLAALAIPIVIAITLRRRSRGVVLAASPVRFEPPSSVRPAELQAGMEGSVTVSGIAATLMDLAPAGMSRSPRGRVDSSMRMDSNLPAPAKGRTRFRFGRSNCSTPPSRANVRQPSATSTPSSHGPSRSSHRSWAPPRDRPASTIRTDTAPIVRIESWPSSAFSVRHWHSASLSPAARYVRLQRLRPSCPPAPV